MSRPSSLTWRVAADGAISLVHCGAVVAVLWPDGRRWRVAVAADARPGTPSPTLDEGKASAVIIARNRTSGGACVVEVSA
jgi:hypothetical protein